MSIITTGSNGKSPVGPVHSWNGSVFASQAPEEGMLGAILVWPDDIAEVASELDEGDLVTPKAQRIYGAMLGLWRRGIRPDYETVLAEITARGELESIGGQYGLFQLMSEAPGRRARTFVRLILEASLRFRIRVALKELDLLAQDGSVTVDDVYEQSKERLASLDRVGTVTLDGEPSDEFIEGEDSFDWLVPGLIERGERMILVAEEGQGKTVLCRQFATTAAYGIHPFGVRRPLAPIRVVLMDLENPPGMVRRKLRPLVLSARHQRPQSDPSMLTVICRTGGIDLAHRSDVRWLTAQLSGYRPDLLVVGPLYKMFSSDDQWERGARTVASVLDDLRTRLGFALIIEAHAPQAVGGNQRVLRPFGSSLWLRWPEFGIAFRQLESHPDVVKMTTWKQRDERTWPHYLKRGGEWPWTPCGDPTERASTATYSSGPADPRYEQEDF